jgi:acetoin utilization deacetylase AcuC-like enzyme
MHGAIENAFCAVRPPGHHCERNESMGFCLLSNVAIAARYLLDVHGIGRVAVVDWDVHHGNGTQHVFEDNADVFYCSLHGHPAYVYPGTGFENERGRGPGEGATLNLPMYPGSDDALYRRAFEQRVLPALDDFKPQFVLISAGFDAHRLDPLAPLNLDSASFEWMTRALMDVAARYAQGRLVSVLEGGYDLGALAESATLHVTELIRHVG